MSASCQVGATLLRSELADRRMLVLLDNAHNADQIRRPAGDAESEADRVLEDLLEANMLMQYTTDRCRYHDLLGLYARRLLADDPESATACSRLDTWYADAVTAAMEWVYPQLVRLDTHPERDVFFATDAEACAWLDVELRGYFLLRRHVDGWLPSAEAGLAATKAGDDAARTAMLISRQGDLGTPPSCSARRWRSTRRPAG